MRSSDRTGLNRLPEGITFLPPLEIDLTQYASSESDLYTNRMKTEWADGDYYRCPAKISPELEKQLQLLAAAVFRVVDCKDVARVDFRIEMQDGTPKPYILEINPLPGLNPIYSDLWIQAKAAGWSYEKLVNSIADQAALRQGLTVAASRM
jgi:D-alanine-D-alanine ligase